MGRVNAAVTPHHRGSPRTEKISCPVRCPAGVAENELNTGDLQATPRGAGIPLSISHPETPNALCRRRCAAVALHSYHLHKQCQHYFCRSHDHLMAGDRGPHPACVRRGHSSFRSDDQLQQRPVREGKLCIPMNLMPRSSPLPASARGGTHLAVRHFPPSSFAAASPLSP
jgi:hypothetical protein